jgi:hypothetical protein
MAISLSMSMPTTCQWIWSLPWLRIVSRAEHAYEDQLYEGFLWERERVSSTCSEHLRTSRCTGLPIHPVVAKVRWDLRWSSHQCRVEVCVEQWKRPPSASMRLWSLDWGKCTSQMWSYTVKEKTTKLSYVWPKLLDRDELCVDLRARYIACAIANNKFQKL